MLPLRGPLRQALEPNMSFGQNRCSRLNRHNLGKSPSPFGSKNGLLVYRSVTCLPFFRRSDLAVTKYRE